MLEAFWAQSTDADTGMGPFPACAAAVAQGKLRAAVQGCSLEKVRLAERSCQENAPSPQHCQPRAIPQLLYLPSDKHEKQSRTREGQGQWDESRW